MGRGKDRRWLEHVETESTWEELRSQATKTHNSCQLYL